jgi:hypothetical protein
MRPYFFEIINPVIRLTGTKRGFDGKPKKYQLIHEPNFTFSSQQR